MHLIRNCDSSDLQLAIALQQQEFEQQPPRHSSQKSSVSGSSRLVTGPQVSLALQFLLHLMYRVFVDWSLSTLFFIYIYTSLLSVGLS